MSESEDSGPGLREVAYRLLAAEFEDSEFSYSESDEERAPNYVVTPTGARVNRMFVVGVLTELEQVNEEVLRARIVDPTGAFVVYAGQYQPEALAFLEGATPPLFVAITGKARTFEPDDGDRVFTSIRPESISEVDAETRDRWVVQAAEQTLDRIGRLASAKESGLSGDQLQSALLEAGVAESDAAGATLALDYYDTSGDYLQALRDLSRNAASVVAGDRDEAGSLSRSPADGTDAPLSALASMELDTPAETPDAPDTPSEKTATDPVDESATADAGTAENAGTSDIPSKETTAETAGESAESTALDADSTAVDSGSTDTQTDSSLAETDSTDAAADSTSSTAETTEPPESDTETEQSGPSTGTSEVDAAAETSDSHEGSSEQLGDFDSADETADDLGDFDSADETADELGDFDSTDETDDEDVGDFDTEFELDEDEREEIEQEYGTDFQSGTEVDDAGEADIETPDPEELAEADAQTAADETADTVAESAPMDESTDTGTEAAPVDETTDEPASDEPPAEDVDLEDAVMEAMTDLNDGSGADREAVISEVVETYGADRAAVEDAVQDALMGGRCYEPDDGKLTPI